MNRQILGVDIGGVIINRYNTNKDPDFFRVKFLDVPEITGAMDSLSLLVNRRFEDQVYLVSNASPIVEQNTHLWFEHRDFYNKTCITREQVIYCRSRKEKSAICSRLKITHFIDDRLEVLSNLTSVQNRYLFNPKVEEYTEFLDSLKHVYQVPDWNSVVSLLLKD